MNLYGGDVDIQSYEIFETSNISDKSTDSRTFLLFWSLNPNISISNPPLLEIFSSMFPRENHCTKTT